LMSTLPLQGHAHLVLSYCSPRSLHICGLASWSHISRVQRTDLNLERLWTQMPISYHISENYGVRQYLYLSKEPQIRFPVFSVTHHNHQNKICSNY
jgi:hypothetical protein